MKITMADGNLDYQHPVGTVSLAEPDPIMPHLLLKEEDLDKQYPAMEVEDVDNNDADEAQENFKDGEDAIYQHGLAEARKITATTAKYGRTKYEGRARPGAGDTKPAGAGEAKPANVSIDNMLIDNNSVHRPVHSVLYV